MTGRIILARHARHPEFGERLLGRTPGIGLDEAGRAEAAALADRLRGEAPVAVVSSPRRRARETADVVGRDLGLPVEINDAFDEIDVGEWSGMRFDALAGDPRWRLWNERRDDARAPGGETMAEAGLRAGRALDALGERFANGAVIVVSHADVIKAVVLAGQGLPMQAYVDLDIGPAEFCVLPPRANFHALGEAV